MCGSMSGVQALQILLLLYKTIFLPTVLYNSQSWTRLTKAETRKLSYSNEIPAKNTTRPGSTSNSATLLELGIISIECEINIRKVKYLHHTQLVYMEQLKYSHESNWANELKNIRIKDHIEISDAEIKMMNKDEWKGMVNRQVYKAALETLNDECAVQKKTSHLTPYPKIKTQKYLKIMNTKMARTYFQLRTGTLDIKTERQYKYQDTRCRLCDNGEEDIQHIVNKCCKMPHHEY